MTAESRFERDLTSILEDLYLGPSPDYRDEAMAAAVRTRQRPSWTFAGRWIPMADIASRPVLAPRVPWRAARAGRSSSSPSRSPRSRSSSARARPRSRRRSGWPRTASSPTPRRATSTPSIPRPARRRAIVAGPDQDAGPVFSPDGTRIAFHRANLLDGSPADDLVVVARRRLQARGDHRGADPGRSPVATSGRRTPARSWSTPPDDSAIWSFDDDHRVTPNGRVAAPPSTSSRSSRRRHVDPDLPADRSRRQIIGCSTSRPRTRPLLATRRPATTSAPRAGPRTGRRSSTTRRRPTTRRRNACSS